MVYLMWIWALFWWASTVFSALVIFNISYSIVYPAGRQVVDAKIDNYMVVAGGCRACCRASTGSSTTGRGWG